MNLENTIQYMYDNYPSLFQERWQALNQLFCVIGNGYEWEGGELVSKEDTKEYAITLDANGKAQPREDMIQAEVQRYFKSIMKRNNEQLDKMLERIASKKGKDVADVRDLYQSMYSDDGESVMEQANKAVRGGIFGDRGINFYPLSNYSAIFTYPTDIKADWLEGIAEVQRLLLEHGHGGNKSEMNDWQKEEHAKWTDELNKLAI